MGSDRIRAQVQSSSSFIPGSKPKEKFSFLQPRYQDQAETHSVQENKQQNNPTPTLSHSFRRMSVRPIQAKLTIGQPNDKYEQEADRVASQVVQQINTPSSAQSTQGQSIQRMDEPEEEEIQTKPSISPVQRRLISPVVQRMEEPEEEEIQTKPSIQRLASTEGGEASSEVTRSNKTGLPDRLKTGVENLSGYSMDDVRVHYNSDKPAQLQALAYTQGTDIHVAPGQEKHLPHEAWHVVQQKQGRVKPTMQMKGIQINDDGGLEKEADVMGKKVLQRQPMVPEEYGSPRRMTMNSEKLIQPDSPRNLLLKTQPSMAPIQMINIGWVPRHPNNWRSTTTLTGHNENTYAGGQMNRHAVENDNITNANTGASQITLSAGHMLSDVGGTDMPIYQDAAKLTPEVDHIVPVIEGGANDFANARVITKAENNDPATPRPHTPAFTGANNDVKLKIYTPITITEHYGAPYAKSTSFQSGDVIKLSTVKLLARYANKTEPNQWSEVNTTLLRQIIFKRKGRKNKNNNIKIT